MTNQGTNGSESSVEATSSLSPTTGHAVSDYFSTDEIFQRVAASADEEFSRSNRLLFLSGLAAGLSIGLSFIARAAITASVPNDASGLIGNLFYPIGFLFIVMGRYQLFTENTLTPVTLVLTRIASLPKLLSNWGIVLGANVLGAALAAFALSATSIFDAETAAVARGFGEHAVETGWWTLFFKGIIAGWLVAGMVWLIHAARDSVTRFITVFAVMYLVPSADLFHCIIGACEALYLVFEGGTSLTTAAFGFFTPVLLGNTLGGVGLVAILNFAQTRELRFPDRDCGQLELTWREWLLGSYNGQPINGIEPLDDEHAEHNDLRWPVSERDYVEGPDDAPVTLVQYGDYECPTSLRIYHIVQECLLEQPEGIRYVYRHLPLSQRHPHATQAAQAADAANRQGRFWDMHDRLFDHQDRLEERDLVAYARELDLDLEQFRADMHSAKSRERVQSDRHSGVQSGVRTTSNLFINGRRYQGGLEANVIIRRIEQIIARQEVKG